MKVRYFALLVFVMVITYSKYSFAHVLKRPLDPVKSEFYEPRKIIEIYLKAVSKGELIIFDRLLTKTMITPIRVEYIYELNSEIQRVTVYSELNKPMPVPGQEGCKIRGVTAVLDADGHIIETTAHIWTE